MAPPLSASSDLTERERTADAPVDSQARYDAILNALTDWMFLLTSDGVFLDFHARDPSDLVAPPEQFLGKSVRDVFPPGLAGGFIACFAEAMNTGGPCALEYSLPMRDGLRHYEARVVRCDRDKVLSIVRDITERKQAEAQAHELRGELAHVGRVSVLGALAGSLAHEINQPLTAIMANAKAALHMITGLPPDLAPLREVLLDIVADSRRAGDVLQRLRTFIRKGAAVLAPVDVNGTIQDVVRLLNSDLLGRRIWLETHLSPERAFVLGDRVQLQQVIVNLVMNAFDAVSECEIGGRRVILRTDCKDREVVVRVVDYGAGASDEQLAHIFEPFFTTKKEGLGLGLSICQAIVSSHGGTLHAERNPDRGMTFTFRLPVSATREPGP
jgi:C4-dicarboxylate-specific signal transduction histidine kinase